jgi:4-amino-4-deoxy-L-arabinose transferase-like glycosyltransferase
MQFQRSHYLLASCVILSAILGLLRFNSLQLGTSYDDAHYIILAESLSSGQGYQLINFPRPQIERAFPPGWSLLLAPLTALFPGNYSVYKFFSLFLSLASIVLTYKIFSKRLGSPYLEILTGLVALNPLLVGTSVTVMSESAYLFFSLLALHLFEKWKEADGAQWNWLILFVAFAAFYTQFIRTIGISLSIALVMYLLLARRFREAGLTVGVIAAGLTVQAWITGAFLSTGYQSQVFGVSFGEKIQQMGMNALGYINETLAGSLIPIFGTRTTSMLAEYGLGWLPPVLNILILLLLLLGMIISRKNFGLMEIYLVIYLLGILTFWNPRVGSVKARFLIPMLPFLYFYFVQGIRILTQRTPRVAVFISIAVAALLLARNAQDYVNPVMNQMTDLSIGTSWVAENAPQDAIVMVNEPVPAYPHLRRKTVAFPRRGQDFETYLNNQGVDYIVIAPRLQAPRSTDLDEFIAKQVLPLLDSDPERFPLVYFNPEHNVLVYQVQR